MELKKLQDEAVVAVRQAAEKISDLTDDKIGTHDSISLQQRLDALQTKLDSRPKRGAMDDETLEARQKVVECITRNKDRPLNCKKEFSDFQARVHAL